MRDHIIQNFIPLSSVSSKADRKCISGNSMRYAAGAALFGLLRLGRNNFVNLVRRQMTRQLTFQLKREGMRI